MAPQFEKIEINIKRLPCSELAVTTMANKDGKTSCSYPQPCPMPPNYKYSPNNSPKCCQKIFPNHKQFNQNVKTQISSMINNQDRRKCFASKLWQLYYIYVKIFSAKLILPSIAKITKWIRVKFQQLFQPFALIWSHLP